MPWHGVYQPTKLDGDGVQGWGRNLTLSSPPDMHEVLGSRAER